MLLPNWLGEMLRLGLQLSHWQQLGLAFLLGSFAVATWSDLKYLAAQREFLEVWLVFLVVVLIHDAVQVHLGQRGRRCDRGHVVSAGRPVASVVAPGGRVVPAGTGRRGSAGGSVQPAVAGAHSVPLPDRPRSGNAAGADAGARPAGLSFHAGRHAGDGRRLDAGVSDDERSGGACGTAARFVTWPLRMGKLTYGLEAPARTTVLEPP